MNAGLSESIEICAERVASVLLAAAVGYALYAVLGDLVSLPELAVYAAAGAIAANLVCLRGLKAFANRGPQFSLRIFDVREIELADDELLLTEADRLRDELFLTDADRVDQTPEEKMLILDDVLAELDPDSRVVRLFDRKAMPTPGQLQSRIDDHLRQGSSPAAQSDASRALSDALAELRRSLR